MKIIEVTCTNEAKELIDAAGKKSSLLEICAMPSIWSAHSTDHFCSEELTSLPNPYVYIQEMERTCHGS